MSERLVMTWPQVDPYSVTPGHWVEQALGAYREEFDIAGLTDEIHRWWDQMLGATGVHLVGGEFFADLRIVNGFEARRLVQAVYARFLEDDRWWGEALARHDRSHPDDLA